jgi:hypothetical protein
MLNTVFFFFLISLLMSMSISIGYAIGAASFENKYPKWLDQINAAIALAIALVLVLSILFRNLLWLSMGGFIILVSGTYLYLRFSTARLYLRLNTPIHLVLLCSYPLLAFPIWKIKVKGLEPGFAAIFDAVLMAGIMFSGVLLLMAGLIGLFVRTNSKYK